MMQELIILLLIGMPNPLLIGDVNVVVDFLDDNDLECTKTFWDCDYYLVLACYESSVIEWRFIDFYIWDCSTHTISYTFIYQEEGWDS